MTTEEMKELLGLEIQFYAGENNVPLMGIMFDKDADVWFGVHPDGVLEFRVTGLSKEAMNEALSFFRLENESKSKVTLSLGDSVFGGRGFDVFYRGEAIIKGARLARTLRDSPVIPYETIRSEGMISILCSNIQHLN